MPPKVILISAYTRVQNIERLLRSNATWLYAGKDLKRYQLFKKLFEPNFMPLCHPGEFQDFASQLQKPFLEWVESINNLYGGKTDYWANVLFCKNPCQSDLFFNISQLMWFKKILSRQKKGTLIIVVESIGLFYSIKKIIGETGLNSSIVVGKRYAWLELFIQSFRMQLGFVISGSRFLARWAAAKICKQNNPSPVTNEKLILINTFLFENDMRPDGEYGDAYLPGLYEWFKKKGWNAVIYPFYYPARTSGLLNFFKKIRKTKSDFFLLEDFIKSTDVFNAFLFPARQIGMFLSYCKQSTHLKNLREFNGLIIGSLILESGWWASFNWMSAEALLQYRFPLRLKQAGFKPKLVILWYENQINEKLSAGGFKKFLPETEITGAQFFVPPSNLLNLFITNSECRYGMAPNKTVCLSNFFKQILSSRQAAIPVEVGPPIRYTYLREISKNLEDETTNSNSNSVRTCIAVLPQTLTPCVDLLIKSMQALEKTREEGVKVLFKPHPTVKKEDIITFADNFGCKLSGDDFIDDKLSEIAHKVTCIVSTESGLILEMICLGIPVVMVGPSVGLKMFPHLPENASMLFKVAYTSEEINHALNGWALKHPIPVLERIKMGREVLETCFSPYSDSLMQVLLPENKEDIGHTSLKS
tara:strand:+ start:4717 stop:6651 length:1935 start_codon:yes stop_codon:yes gene_type:complete